MTELPARGRRTAQPAEIKNAMRQYKRKNAMVFGSGAAVGSQDRGGFQEISTISSNPYDYVNYLYRWQTYVRWYYKAWEARKIIDIPIEDAMRKPFEIKGLDANDAKILMNAYDELKGDRQFRRAQKQRRLLGGCILLPLVADGSKYWSEPLNLQNVQPGRGNFKALNLVDIQKISQLNLSNDPFAADYDKPQSYSINGQDVHISRCIVFDGDPLLSMSSTNVYQLGRINPSGFSESVLTPIYDLLIRVTGSQQGAYHLINMASVLLAKVDQLKELSGTNNKALAVIQQLMYSISIFNAGIIEGKGVDITQHSATFGSVPELLMMFLQILSASCDIPATRFLGQAPGGLNATGESDLENYYNVIDAYQRMELKPRLRQLFDIIGCCQWGYTAWQVKKQKLDFNFPALWNLTEKEEAEKNEIIARSYVGLFDANIINAQQLFDELKARQIFQTDVAFDTQLEALREQMQEQDAEAGAGDIGLEGLKKEADGAGEEKKKTQVANASFVESEHPRASDGEWTSGGGGGKGKELPKSRAVTTAEKHKTEWLSKNDRKKIMVDAGIDPASREGQEFTDTYKKLYTESQVEKESIKRQKEDEIASPYFAEAKELLGEDAAHEEIREAALEMAKEQSEARESDRIKKLSSSQRISEGVGDKYDIMSVVEDEIFAADIGLSGRSAKSEAAYYGDEDGENRIRVASHSVVHDVSDTRVFIGIGKEIPDADFNIPEDATVDEIKAITKKAIEKFKTEQPKEKDNE